MLVTLTERWQEAYPGAALGILALNEAANPGYDERFHQTKLAIEAQLRARFAGQDRAAIKALPTIQAYNAYYKKFSKSYHVQLQLESVAFKAKSIPDVACLVEAMFVAELKNWLLTAGHDLDRLVPPLRMDVAAGEEPFASLRGETLHLKAGDMYIADGDGIISTILYGPDERTQIRPETRRALYTVYAPPGVSADLVRLHLEDIRDNVLIFAPQAKTEQLEVYSAR